jgi:hypothetical protein
MLSPLASAGLGGDLAHVHAPSLLDLVGLVMPHGVENDVVQAPANQACTRQGKVRCSSVEDGQPQRMLCQCLTPPYLLDLGRGLIVDGCVEDSHVLVGLEDVVQALYAPGFGVEPHLDLPAHPAARKEAPDQTLDAPRHQLRAGAIASPQ